MSLRFTEEDFVNSNAGSADWAIVSSDDDFDIIGIVDTTTSCGDISTSDNSTSASSNSIKLYAVSNIPEWRGPLTLIEIAKLKTPSELSKIAASVWGRLGTVINEFTPVWARESRLPTQEECQKQARMVAQKAQIDGRYIRASNDFEVFIKEVKLPPNLTDEKEKYWNQFSESIKNAQKIDEAIAKKIEDFVRLSWPMLSAHQ